MNRKIKNLINFIDNSPSAYHAVDLVKKELTSAGFTELSLKDGAKIADGGKHFIVSGGSSVIAFEGCGNGFMIVASHSDSPAFRVKTSFESAGAYNRLSVEKYGGMIH